MGGSHETRLPGSDNLRIHESGGDVHVHDDLRGTKFCMSLEKFKKEYARVKHDLEAKISPFSAHMTSTQGVLLIGELDVDKVEWSLQVHRQAAPPVAVASELSGFVALDQFVGQL